MGLKTISQSTKAARGRCDFWPSTICPNSTSPTAIGVPGKICL